MKKRRTRTTDGVVFKHPTSVKDLLSRTLQSLNEIRRLLQSVGEETQYELLERFCKANLVVSIPSPCYMIPYPFLAFNVTDVEKGTRNEWAWEDPKQRKVGTHPFTYDLPSTYFIYLGFRLWDMEQVDENQIQVCRKRWAEENTITTCFPEEMLYSNALETYWHPSEHQTRSLFERIERTQHLLREVLTVDETNNWP